MHVPLMFLSELREFPSSMQEEKTWLELSSPFFEIARFAWHASFKPR